MNDIVGVICGGTKAGKSSLAMGFSRGVNHKHGLGSLIFDPWCNSRNPRRPPMDWGPQAMVFDDIDLWKKAVRCTQGYCVIWDDATANGGRDSDNVGLFTQGLHNHPVILCMTHSYTALLPTMRTNVTDVYLALTDPDDADKWARAMRDRELRRAADESQVPQYSFLHKSAYKEIRLISESVGELKRGIQP